MRLITCSKLLANLSVLNQEDKQTALRSLTTQMNANPRNNIYINHLNELLKDIEKAALDPHQLASTYGYRYD